MNLDIITTKEMALLEEKLDQVIRLLNSSFNSGEKEIYTTQQLAKKLAVSTKTIQNWREQKMIEFSQVGHKIYYTGISVNEFLAGHSIKRKSHNYGKGNNYLTNLKIN